MKFEIGDKVILDYVPQTDTYKGRYKKYLEPFIIKTIQPCHKCLTKDCPGKVNGQCFGFKGIYRLTSKVLNLSSIIEREIEIIKGR